MSTLIVTAIVVACMAKLIWTMARVGKRDAHYDEMQMKLRAESYRLGYMSLLLLSVAVIALDAFGLLRWVDVTMGIMTAVMASVVLFAVYCIRHGAFFGLGQKRETTVAYVLLLALVVVSNGATAIARIARGALVENGVVTFASGYSLVMAIGFLIVLIALMVKRLTDGGEDAE